MADGKGSRWQNYNNIPKHFIEINGEKIIERTVRLLTEHGAEEVIITSHDDRYEIKGARRYEPKNNVLEIDRFTEELIEDNVCFLYGDTYYSDECIKSIFETETDDILFFGNEKSVVAIKVKDGERFRAEVQKVRTQFLEGKTDKCKGWQVYRSFVGLPLDSKKITGNFVMTDNTTEDFNTPKDYLERK